MATRRMIGVSCVLPLVASLAIALPGCGGAPATNTDGTVKTDPIVNPAPGALEPEKPTSK